MTNERYRKFLEMESKKLKKQKNSREDVWKTLMEKEEFLKDAQSLAEKISPEDYENIKQYFYKRNFEIITFLLRKYGLEFKGLIHLEILVNELIRIKEAKRQK